MVQPGENLTYIAQVCQVPLAFLKQTNTGIDDPDHIDIGAKVCVLSNCTDNLFAAVGAPASPGGTLVQGMFLCPPPPDPNPHPCRICKLLADVVKASASSGTTKVPGVVCLYIPLYPIPPSFFFFFFFFFGWPVAMTTATP